MGNENKISSDVWRLEIIKYLYEQVKDAKGSEYIGWRYEAQITKFLKNKLSKKGNISGSRSPFKQGLKALQKNGYIKLINRDTLDIKKCENNDPDFKDGGNHYYRIEKKGILWVENHLGAIENILHRKDKSSLNLPSLLKRIQRIYDIFPKLRFIIFWAVIMSVYVIMTSLLVYYDPDLLTRISIVGLFLVAPHAPFAIYSVWKLQKDLNRWEDDFHEELYRMRFELYPPKYEHDGKVIFHNLLNIFPYLRDKLHGDPEENMDQYIDVTEAGEHFDVLIEKTTGIVLRKKTLPLLYLGKVCEGRLDHHRLSNLWASVESVKEKKGKGIARLVVVSDGIKKENIEEFCGNRPIDLIEKRDYGYRVIKISSS